MKPIPLKHALAIAILCCAPVNTLAQESGQPERVYEISEVESAPLLLNPGELFAAHDSLYPAERRRGGRGATVEMSFVIGRDGIPASITIVRSTDQAFNSASLAAAALLRFNPATAGGGSQAVRVHIPMRWNNYIPSSEWAPTRASYLRGRRRQISGVPVYDLWEVSVLGQGPTFDRRTLQQMALRLPRGGAVVAEIVVSAQGEVIDSQILSSLDPRRNAAVLNATRAMRLAPASLFGAPVHVSLPVSVPGS